MPAIDPTRVRSTLWLLGALAALALAVAALAPAIPDPPALRSLVDRRTVLRIPNFWDVVSNLPLIFVGVLGALVLRRDVLGRFIDPLERWPYFAAFIAIALTGIGSSYYHLLPVEPRLMWDRLPIALSFMALVAALAGDPLGGRSSVRLLAPLLVLGAGSVLYWRWSALRGAENIVPYAIVQYGALFAIVVLAARLPSRYTRNHDVLIAAALYVAAKIAELLDAPIYALGGLISGHTLKHLLAALAAWWVLRMLKLRRPLNPPS
jgi:hypothetical protein